MKNLIVFLVISFFSENLLSNLEPEQSTRYVYAFSGIKLRTTPSSSGQVLKVIPYGDKVEVTETSTNKEVIEWMSGYWIKVVHEQTEGYLFEGFVSELPIPAYTFEMTQNDMDLTYPIIAWAEFHYDETSASDTVQHVGFEKITQYLENEVLLYRRYNVDDFEVVLELSGVKIEEAYNLVKSMLLTKAERLIFEENSIFVADKNNDIHKIKVQFDNPIEIRRLSNGKIRIKATTYHYGCGL